MATPFLARFSFAALGSLLLTLGATSTSRGQTTSAPTQTPAPAQSQQQTPQKKVWTNDNLGGSHTQPNDTPGSTQQNSNSGSAAPAKAKSKKDAKWYHDQIAKLQAQIPPLDKTIAELQAALDGKTLNEPLHYGGERIGDMGKSNCSSFRRSGKIHSTESPPSKTKPVTTASNPTRFPSARSALNTKSPEA